jgi:hypothetical protein
MEAKHAFFFVSFCGFRRGGEAGVGGDHGRPAAGEVAPFLLDSASSFPLLVEPSQPLRTEPSPPPRAHDTVLAKNACHRRPPWLLPPPLPKARPNARRPPLELPSELMSERLTRLAAWRRRSDRSTSSRTCCGSRSVNRSWSPDSAAAAADATSECPVECDLGSLAARRSLRSISSSTASSFLSSSSLSSSSSSTGITRACGGGVPGLGEATLVDVRAEEEQEEEHADGHRDDGRHGPPERRLLPHRRCLRRRRRRRRRRRLRAGADGGHDDDGKNDEELARPHRSNRTNLLVYLSRIRALTTGRNPERNRPRVGAETTNSFPNCQPLLLIFPPPGWKLGNGTSSYSYPLQWMPDWLTLTCFTCLFFHLLFYHTKYREPAFLFFSFDLLGLTS